MRSTSTSSNTNPTFSGLGLNPGLRVQSWVIVRPLTTQNGKPFTSGTPRNSQGVVHANKAAYKRPTCFPCTLLCSNANGDSAVTRHINYNLKLQSLLQKESLESLAKILAKINLRDLFYVYLRRTQHLGLFIPIPGWLVNELDMMWKKALS
jgi:hypothetical protein